MARSTPDLTKIDPRGLIGDAYRIDGIGESECRSIFLDWAIGVPQGRDAKSLLPVLLEYYGVAEPDHPMTRVLKEGLGQAGTPRRRGGRRGRSG